MGDAHDSLNRDASLKPTPPPPSNIAGSRRFCGEKGLDVEI
jgi:hypothetical protein